jgi:hypothetical protein
MAHSARYYSMNQDPIPGTHEPNFVEERIIQTTVPVGLGQSLGVHVSTFKMGECTIILAREPAGVNGELLWHLSIGGPNRHPTWDEIKTIRYRLLDPALTFGMLLPPRRFYVNVPAHDHVFHIWEVSDPREPWSAG